jgi:CubicO group peptidase (beta-lactamase class C family)
MVVRWNSLSAGTTIPHAMRGRDAYPRGSNRRERIVSLVTVSPGFVLFLIVTTPLAQATELMQGSPPPPEALVTQANWRTPPYNVWGFRHVDSFVPTTAVDRGTGSVSELPVDTADLSKFEFTDFTGKRRDLATFLADQHVDALLLWSNGRLRQEIYRSGQTARDRHMLFSVTKSFTGLLAEMLIAEGVLDETKSVATYLPELRGSAWADASVRNVLDMEVGIDFAEVYDDPDSDISHFSYVAGMRTPPPGVTPYASLYEYLPTLRKKGEHGQDFHYVTANSEVLGWLLERVTGTPIAQLFGQRVYEWIGAERDAFYTVDPHGKSIAGGGLNATARDALRLALMMSNDGYFNGRQIVPQEVVRRISAGGTPRPSLWGNETGGRDNSYKSQWYYYHPNRTLSAAGIHGQNIHIAVGRDVVMVTQSSYPQADGLFFGVTDGFFAAVADYLGAKPRSASPGNR